MVLQKKVSEKNNNWKYKNQIFQNYIYYVIETFLVLGFFSEKYYFWVYYIY